MYPPSGYAPAHMGLPPYIETEQVLKVLQTYGKAVRITAGSFYIEPTNYYYSLNSILN